MSEKLLERETIINFNDFEPTARIWSASPSFQRRMAKLGLQPTKTDQRDGNLCCWYEVPKKFARVAPTRKTRILSEEQRNDLAERARARFSRRKGAGKENNQDG